MKKTLAGACGMAALVLSAAAPAVAAPGDNPNGAEVTQYETVGFPNTCEGEGFFEGDAVYVEKVDGESPVLTHNTVHGTGTINGDEDAIFQGSSTSSPGANVSTFHAINPGPETDTHRVRVSNDQTFHNMFKCTG